MSNYTMNKKTNYMAVSAAAILVTAFVLVQPMQARSEVTFEGIQDLTNCFLKTHPDLTERIEIADPISMNTIVGKANGDKMAKTIHAEKEIFECRTVQGNIAVIVDVTTYAELYENMTLTNGEPAEDPIFTQVQVVTCVKLEDEARLVGCEESRPSTNDQIVQNCIEQPIEHPQEMNTVNKGNGNGLIKTVEAQKEIFLCDLDGDSSGGSCGIGLPGSNQACRDDDKKVDVIIFTEIWENLVSLDSTPTDPTIAKDIISLRCIVKIASAQVEFCEFSLPDRIFP